MPLFEDVFKEGSRVDGASLLQIHVEECLLKSIDGLDRKLAQAVLDQADFDLLLPLLVSIPAQSPKGIRYLL